MNDERKYIYMKIVKLKIYIDNHIKSDDMIKNTAYTIVFFLNHIQ